MKTRRTRQVAAALRQMPELRSADLTVAIEGEAIVLLGTVDDRHLATVAEQVARTAAGPYPVHNRIGLRPEIGEEAGPKSTEFGDKSHARAVTGTTRYW